MTVGRPNKGLAHVDNLDATEHEKERLRMVLRTIFGELSVQEACEELGIQRAQFQELRARCLQAAADALVPGRPGRPRERDVEQDDELFGLRSEVERLNDELDRKCIQLDLIEEIPGLAGRAQKGGDPAIDRAVRSLRRR